VEEPNVGDIVYLGLALAVFGGLAVYTALCARI
jgi:hypothetical protein